VGSRPTGATREDDVNGISVDDGLIWVSCDASCQAVEIADLPDGGKAMRNALFPRGGVLYFTRAEWDAFVRGVQRHEFDV
jgi:Domain of unknown function (DUF397)